MSRQGGRIHLGRPCSMTTYYWISVQLPGSLKHICWRESINLLVHPSPLLSSWQTGFFICKVCMFQKSISSQRNRLKCYTFLCVFMNTFSSNIIRTQVVFLVPLFENLEQYNYIVFIILRVMVKAWQTTSISINVETVVFKPAV